ncbi:MAG: hypothetical protein J5753_05910, partial [Oscillospiraceae bacterium]|nr:hypothetical protein [Oscillospiraceae bacterium]
RTDSVYPAAIFHAMNNNGGAALGVMLLVNSIGDPETFTPDTVQFIVLLIPTVIVAAITLALMLRRGKKGSLRDD